MASRFVMKKGNSIRGNSFCRGNKKLVHRNSFFGEKRKTNLVQTHFVTSIINAFRAFHGRKKNSFRGKATATVVKFDIKLCHEIIVLRFSKGGTGSAFTVGYLIFTFHIFNLSFNDSFTFRDRCTFHQ